MKQTKIKQNLQTDPQPSFKAFKLSYCVVVQWEYLSLR